MDRQLFTEEEAKALVGRTVRTTIAFSGVPAGTEATVIQADRSRDGFTVALQWHLPADPARGFSGKPLVDWFDKSEYDRWIEEV